VSSIGDGAVTVVDRAPSLRRITRRRPLLGALPSNIGFSGVNQAAPMVVAFLLAPYLIHHLGVDRVVV